MKIRKSLLLLVFPFLLAGCGSNVTNNEQGQNSSNTSGQTEGGGSSSGGNTEGGGSSQGGGSQTGGNTEGGGSQTGGNTEGGGSQTGGNTEGGGGSQKDEDPFPELTMAHPSYDYHVMKDATFEYKFQVEKDVPYTFRRTAGYGDVTLFNVDGTEFHSKTSLGLDTSMSFQSPTSKLIRIVVTNTAGSNIVFKYWIDDGKPSVDNMPTEKLNDPFKDTNLLYLDTSVTIDKKATVTYKFPVQANYAYQIRNTSSGSCYYYVTVKDENDNVMNQIDKILIQKIGSLSLNSPVGKYVKITIENTYSTMLTGRMIVESSFARNNL